MARTLQGMEAHSRLTVGQAMQKHTHKWFWGRGSYWLACVQAWHECTVQWAQSGLKPSMAVCGCTTLCIPCSRPRKSPHRLIAGRTMRLIVDPVGGEGLDLHIELHGCESHLPAQRMAPLEKGCTRIDPAAADGDWNWAPMG